MQIINIILLAVLLTAPLVLIWNIVEMRRRATRGTIIPSSLLNLTVSALEKAFTSSVHVLSTAGASSYFFDFDRLVMDWKLSRHISDAIIDKIEKIKKIKKIDRLAFIEKREENTIGPLLLASCIAQRTKINFIIVRMGRLITLDRVKLPKNENIKDLKIVLLTDVLTTGREISSAIQAIEKVGGVVSDIIVVLFRGTIDVKDRFEQKGTTLHSIFNHYIIDLAIQQKKRGQGSDLNIKELEELEKKIFQT